VFLPFGPTHLHHPRAARKASQAGGSLRDVQQLAGHASLNMTPRYIEGDSNAKRKLINLI
jgi:integrase/recombinase XerD